ncbi:MAG: hypothetical protein E4G99_11115 [Anaerolineales bacterium]|nr:MAG: hypothetical protein E4G99_11115 [Anaerolineales bacterium]
MKPLPNLPELRIVNSRDLHPHEEVDASRVGPLRLALEADGILKNPPVVMPFPGRPDEYMVLDGANRTTAFKELGIDHNLVQIVRPGREEMRLRTWNKVVYGAPPERLFHSLYDLFGVVPAPSDRKERLERYSSRARLAYLSLPDGSAWEVGAERRELPERTQLLRQLDMVSSEIGQAERTSEVEASHFSGIFKLIAGLVIFPPFEIEEVLEVAAQNLSLPSGLTRFIIGSRALRINYPLVRLQGSGSIESKQKELEDWIEERLRMRSIRYYAESTFSYDD